MKRGKTRRVALAVAMALIGVAATRSQAQNATKESTEKQLAVKVHLALGSATLAQTLAELSRQSGLTISTESYLSERRLTVQMEAISTASVLNALAELEDLTWYTTEPGHILVTKRKLRVSNQSVAIPRLIQVALPRDLRDYLGIPRPSNDINRYVNPLLLDSDRRTTYAHRASDAYGQYLNSLMTSLDPGTLSARPLNYSFMSEEQKRDLIGLLLFRVIAATDFNLLHADLVPYAANPASAILRLQSAGNMLIVGSQFQDGGRTVEVSFGAQIQP